MILKRLLLFVIALHGCCAWDNDDLELFDLVEEINQNFYEVLDVPQTAASSEIRKAYRRLSLQLHPDKNKEEDAEVRFRNLVAVYEVLKEKEKRQRYDDVLENGLPDWRQPVFYYRRVRKLGLLELAALLMVILTVGHFLVAWSIYAEQKFTKEELFRSKKKMPKGNRKSRQQADEVFEAELQEFLSCIPRPQWRDLFPLCLIQGTASVAKAIVLMAQTAMEKKAEENTQDEDEEVLKRPRRLRVQTPDAEFVAEMSEYQAPVAYQSTEERTTEDNARSTERTEAEWSDADSALLAKAVAKFPGGTSQRWERIGEYICRTPAEALARAKKQKLGMHRGNVDVSSQGITGKITEKISMKKGKEIDDVIISTRDAEAEESSDQWTQYQQKILETSLAQFPKSTTGRWEKIAEQIPGKSKEDCIVRFKFLAEIVKKRKAAKLES